MSSVFSDPPFSAPSSPVHWDRYAAAAGLLVVFPLLAFIWLTLRAVGQPPIFCQDRVGYREEVFTIYKFRTLPQEGWDAFAQAAERRAGLYRRVAALMRATGIDELPQLWNVARGDMRVIGPRPLTPEDFAALPELRHLRCRIPPGIAGLAQVNGGQALDPASKLALDLYQLEHLGVRLWLRIALRSAGRLMGFTSLISSPCPVTLEKAWTEVARLAQAAGMAQAAVLTLDGAGRAPRLEGSFT